MRGDGRIYLRGIVYWCAYFLRGQEFRESTGETDPDKALKFLRNRLKEVHSDELGHSKFATPTARRVTLDDLLDSLKSDLTLRGKASPQNLSTIKLAKEAFGHVLALAFGPKHVDRFITEKLAEHYRPASVNRITGVVGQAFALAVREGRVSKIPYIKHLSERENIRQGFASKDEVLQVCAHLPEDLRDICMFGFLSGWRRGEIAKLDWSNVQDNDTMIRLRPDQTKNKTGRSLPIDSDPELAAIIKRRREARRLDVNGTAQLSRLVFHRGDGLPLGDFRKSWKAATKQAGLPGLLFHDLRRSAVTAWVNAGIPQLTAMGLSGHRTAAMFARYNIQVEEEQRDAMRAVAAYHERKLMEAGQKAKAENVVAMRQG